tara:strand:+ start:311 stop:493 length:183 start_codon:yes stop_codon:yes gene_type:complete
MKESDNLDKRMALLEQKLDLVLDNHLHHMEKDMAMIKKILGGVAIVVFGQLLAIVITMSI